MKSKIAKVALRTSLLYAVVAAAWILFSDRVLVAFVSDPHVLMNLDIYKDCGFVAVTALLIYTLLRGQLRRLEQEAAERKRAQEALRNSDEQHRAVLENQTEIISRFKAGHTYTFVNDVFCQFFGKTRQELLGSKWRPEVLPEDLQLVEQKVNSLSPANPVVLIENRVRSGSGEMRWLLFSNRAFFDEQNRLVEVQSVGRDITERKQVEEALRSSERLLRLVMDLVPHFIFVKDQKSRHLLVNRACAEATTLTADQMVGLSDLDMAPGSAQAKAFMRDDQEVIASGRPKFTEEKLIDARGQTRILQTTKIPFPSSTISFPVVGNGKPAILGVAVDITARKLAEDVLQQKQAQLVEALRIARLAYWEYDVLDDQFTFNDQFYSILRTTAEREGGHTMSAAEYVKRFVHPDDAAVVGTEIRKAIAATDPNYSRELDHRIIYADGEVGYFNVYFRIQKDAQGRTIKTHGASMDITERKQVEEQLAKERNLLRALMDNIPDGIYFKDRESHFTQINPALARHFGLSDPAEAAGNADFDFFSKEHAQQAYEDEQAIIRSGEPVVGKEEKETWSDGRIGWVSTTKMPLRNQEGQIVGTFGISRDITERKQAEETLVHERQLLRTLIDLLPETFYIKDLDSRFLVANEALAKHFGKETSSQILGLSDVDFFPAELAAKFRAEEVKVFGGKPLIDKEDSVVFPDGRKYTLLTTKVPFRDSQGRIQGLVGIGRDITERKQADETNARLATAVQQAAEAIVITDPKATILYVNPAFERITGYTSPEVVGQNPRILKSGKHDAAFYRQMWDTLSRGKVWSGRIINKKKNGALYEEETSISSVFDSNGKIANYVAVKRDVTQEVALETQLRQAQKMEIIGQLAGGVAHDFNNILTVIQGNASLLQNAGLKPAEEAECTQQIIHAAERAASLTRQLLMFSRKQVMQPANLSLNEAVAQMTKMLRRILGEHIALQSNYAANLPFIHGDIGMIEQILMNLVVNARDAMPAGGSLTITTGVKMFDKEQAEQSPGASPGLHVWLAVSDTGSGIAPENLPRIFEPFFTTKEVGKGTGLGLATVYGIVQQHHGWITLTSEVNKGTTFHIFFPAAVNAEPEKKAELLIS
ncbi:MAG: PAS domain S-box protein [Verrucomicrobiota bacterium]